MSHRKITIFVFSALVLVLGSYLLSAFQNKSVDLTRIKPEDLPDYPTTTEAIRVFQEKIKDNPGDAASYTILGNLFLRAARETGDISNYQKAEQAFLTALEWVPEYRLAQTSLASAYYAQHQFAAALDIAQDVHARDINNIQALALLGDAHLSIGNYPEAEAAYQQLAELSSSPPIWVRLAHLAELKGDLNKALDLMQRAGEESLKSGSSNEELAWYSVRIGELYFNEGDLKQAQNYYEASLRILDNYYLGLAGMGKVSAAQGKYQRAIDYFKRTVEIIPQPEYLAALGDVYTLAGYPDQAEQQYDTVIFIGELAERTTQVYNRQLALFYADHDIHLDEAYRLAVGELANRSDIHGYDAAAWTSYKIGEMDQAAVWIAQALKLGTREAQLYYHAGMIALERGEVGEARALLDLALEINPYFDPIQAEIARDNLTLLVEVATP